MGTLVEKLSNCCDYFLRFSGFPNLSRKVFLISFKFSERNYSARAIVNKIVEFFLVALKCREIIAVKTVTLYFFIKALKARKRSWR